VCEDDNNDTGSAVCQIHHHRSAADSEFFVVRAVKNKSAYL